MDGVAREFAGTYPGTAEGKGIRVVGDIREHPSTLAALRDWTVYGLSAMSLALLIACANVANLMLARGIDRRGEIGLRLALGCSRRRVIGGLLSESFLLAAGGGALGLFVAFWTQELLIALLPIYASSGAALEPTIDVRVITFAVTISALTTLTFGLAPAIRASRHELFPTLVARDYWADTRTRWRPSPMRFLVVGQVALSVVLLVGTGLFVRTVWNLTPADPGFETEHLLLARLEPPVQDSDAVRPDDLYFRLLERLQARPEFVAVSLASSGPGWGGLRMTPYPEGAEPPTGEVRASREPTGGEVILHLAEVDYFRAAGIPLRRGRGFAREDQHSGARVAVVNATLARRLWPGEEPVGQRLVIPRHPFFDVDRHVVEVVGVAADIILIEPSAEARPLLWLPYWLYPGARGQWSPMITLRTVGRAVDSAAEVRSEIAALDPDLRIRELITGEEWIGQAVAAERLAADFTGIVALLALILAGIGLHGLVAHATTRRMREIGVRMALGARGGNIVALVLKESLGLLAVGIAVGWIASLAAGRLITGRLSGVNPWDPVVYGVVALLMVGVAMLASWVPARRAAGVDVAETLRSL